MEDAPSLEAQLSDVERRIESALTSTSRSVAALKKAQKAART